MLEQCCRKLCKIHQKTSLLKLIYSKIPKLQPCKCIIDHIAEGIVYKKTDEWNIEWQRMTTSDNEWQRVITSGTTSDNEWYNEWQRITMIDNEWQWVVILANFAFFRIREEPTTIHPKENSLNIKDYLEERLLN